MANDSIQAAAFRPATHLGPYTAEFRALAFPRAWRQTIIDLYAQGKKNPERYKTVPIRRLNATLRALAPDLVSVARYAGIDDSAPWLYTTADYPATVLGAVVGAFLTDLQPGPAMFPRVQEARAALDINALRWKPTSVDLLAHTIGPGGAAQPQANLYHLLPDILAGRIEQLSRDQPYLDEGVQLTFRQVSTEKGAELMAWPAHPHRDENGVTWQFSSFIKITLQTVPLTGEARIHLHTGVRRWLGHKSVYFPARHGVSAYLLTDGPWLTGAPQSARIAVASMAYDTNLRQVAWRNGGPQGMLAQLSVAREFPPADQLAKEPGRWFTGQEAVTAAVVHHTMMGSHAVGAGLMPRDRQPLTDWAAQALEPEFVRIGDPIRSTLPTPPLKLPSVPRTVSTPFGATDEQREQIKADKAAALREAADVRRPMVATVIGSTNLHVDMFWQTPEIRDALVTAATAYLGLEEASDPADQGVRSWRSPELSLHLHLHDLGASGAPLPGDTALRRRENLTTAITERRGLVRDRVKNLETAARLALVELDRRDRFPLPAADPKFALRLGFADAGRVTQFISPVRSNADRKSATHRAQAAWLDGLRQLGMRLVPQHSLGDLIPDNLGQVAFWLVKRRADGPTGHSLFMPIAVWIRPQHDCILGRTPDTGGWVPYPDLLLHLAAQGPQPPLFRDQQRIRYGMFVKQVLTDLRYEPTLVLTHAQNSRSDWPWLQDGALVPDRIQFGDGPVTSVAAYGQHLRLARLRVADGGETAQWWSANPRTGKPGLPSGLWKPAGATGDNRIFGSTSPKAGPFRTSAVAASRYVPRMNQKGEVTVDTEVPAWNPANLEIVIAGCQPTDSPEALAMFLHQQRFAADYADALALPLAQHMAKLAAAYALPNEEPETIKIDEAEPDFTEAAFEQLALSFEEDEDED